jgi:hypothetical protein
LLVFAASSNSESSAAGIVFCAATGLIVAAGGVTGSAVTLWSGDTLTSDRGGCSSSFSFAAVSSSGAVDGAVEATSSVAFGGSVIGGSLTLSGGFISDIVAASSVMVAGSNSFSALTAACRSALADLMSRGGPSDGFTSFGGSDFVFFVVRPFLGAIRAEEVPPKMFPRGRSICRSRLRRSANCLATISSMVLDALFTSIPWSRLSRSMTS